MYCCVRTPIISASQRLKALTCGRPFGRVAAPPIATKCSSYMCSSRAATLLAAPLMQILAPPLHAIRYSTFPLAIDYVCLGKAGEVCPFLDSRPMSNSFDRQCNALPYTDAHGAQSKAPLNFHKLVERRRNQPRSTRAQWMPKCNCPSIRIDAGVVIGDT